MKEWLRRLMVPLLLAGACNPAFADTYTQTRYPIVLVHGWLGFSKMMGVLDFWYGIPPQLTAGGAKVYVASVSASNSATVRGDQLIRSLDTWRALSGNTKFNLIGHSLGGPTARYVASVRPDLVASVSSVGSPHTGTPVADALATLAPEGTIRRALTVTFVNTLGSLIGVLSGNNDPQDSLGTLQSLSSAGAAAFNARHPFGMPTTACGQGASRVNGINYYSFGGVSTLTNIFDIGDATLVAGSVFFNGDKNDGVVGRCSSHWGTVIRDDLPWNHLDEVNQIFGLRGLFSPDPKAIYRTHANRLKNAGL